MRASSTCCEITSTSCAKGCASTPKSRLNDRTRCGYRANGEKVAAATEAASKLLTRREVRRHGQHSARLQISRLSAVGPPGGLDEPEPGWLASREDTDEVDAHHACGRHLRRRVHRTGGACASGRHVAHAARLRDAAGARRREPALLRHLCVWGSQAAVRLQLLSDQAR